MKAPSNLLTRSSYHLKDISPTRNKSKDFQTTIPYQTYGREYMNKASPLKSNSRLPDVFKSEVLFTDHSEQTLLTKFSGSPQEKVPVFSKSKLKNEVLNGLKTQIIEKTSGNNSPNNYMMNYGNH